MRFLPILVVFGALLLAACSPAQGGSAKDLPPGDVSRGAQLFTQAINGAPTCSSCHTLDGTTLVGPSLRGYKATAPTRIGNTSAEDYTYKSIVQPAAHVVSGFANTMYNQYAQRLTPQQISDLLAYLLSL
jgi:mono/diheme cytochrome c family protein